MKFEFTIERMWFGADEEWIELTLMDKRSYMRLMGEDNVKFFRDNLGKEAILEVRVKE